MKRLKYNRRFVNVVVGFGKKRGACLRCCCIDGYAASTACRCIGCAAFSCMPASLVWLDACMLACPQTPLLPAVTRRRIGHRQQQQEAMHSFAMHSSCVGAPPCAPLPAGPNSQ